MVVAHVLTSLEIGGGERVALELASGQVAASHEVMVVSLAPPPNGPLESAFRAQGVAVHRVAKGAGVDVTLPLRLAALFLRRRVGVVHVHNRMPLIYGAPAGRLTGAVVVHTRHGPRPSTPRQRWLERNAGRFIHAYVAVSPELRELAASTGDFAPEKLTVIENGVDLKRFETIPEEGRAVRAALGIPPEARVLGSVGRFAPEKDYPLLVRATAPLLGPRTRLLIVGDGSEMTAVRAEVAAHNVEAFVSLTGARDDVPRYLAAMDVFVLSSRMEGMPLVVLEAMAAGLPVVASAVGGLPKLIQDGQTGFLVPPQDAEALRRRIETLLDEPDSGRRVAERARAQVRENHSRDTMVRRYLELYARKGART
jgi:glycosyltransferase involved in cell wall biosynthesis